MTTTLERGQTTEERAYKVTAYVDGQPDKPITRTVIAVDARTAIESAWTSLFIGLPEGTAISATAKPIPA
jgi:hypothetical protein